MSTDHLALLVIMACCSLVTKRDAQWRCRHQGLLTVRVCALKVSQPTAGWPSRAVCFGATWRVRGYTQSSMINSTAVTVESPARGCTRAPL
jgi:hypothetical protein